VHEAIHQINQRLFKEARDVLALALYLMHYNFARPHKTLANLYPTTPAMAAGITNHVRTIEEIVK
jgi:hypothetical protein